MTMKQETGNSNKGASAPIANCPVCGEEPRIEDEDYPYYSYHCCGHAVYADDKAATQWNRYAAAMELAEAKTWEEETYAVLCWLDELPDRKCAFNDNVDLNIYAERAGIDALAKVYEVFK